MKKFEIAKHNDITKINEWFEYCKQHQIPFVTIKTYAKYSTVGWDYITFNKDIDTILVDKRDDNINKALLSFHKYKNNKSTYQLSSYEYIFKEIYIVDAPKLAEEIFDLITSNLETKTV